MTDRVWRWLGSGPFLAASILACAAYAGLVLGSYAVAAAAYTPSGGGFDTSFFYTAREALDRAAAFDTAGRFAYIADRWTMDLVWPIVYGTLFASAAAFALRRLEPISIRVSRAVRMTVLAGPALDYAENIAATVLVASVPGRPLGWAVAASVFTLAKWTVIALTGAAVLGLYAMFAARGLGRLRRKR